jgi:hypothetical protein
MKTNAETSTVWVRFTWRLPDLILDSLAPAPYRIRGVCSDEVDAVLRVVLAAYASDPVWENLFDGIKDRMTKRVAATFGAPDAHYLVAEFKGDIVAVSGIARSHWTGQNFLTGICVTPEHHRKGLGKHLLAASLGHLRAWGLSEARVYTEAGSLADRKLYPLFCSTREEGVAYPGARPVMKHNIYFEGRVQSLALMTKDGPATVGVITPGRYTFSTEFEEHVVIATGTLRVRLPQQEWKTIAESETYQIPRRCSFDVEADADVSYICYYR